MNRPDSCLICSNGFQTRAVALGHTVPTEEEEERQVEDQSLEEYFNLIFNSANSGDKTQITESINLFIEALDNPYIHFDDEHFDTQIPLDFFIEQFSNQLDEEILFLLMNLFNRLQDFASSFTKFLCFSDFLSFFKFFVYHKCKEIRIVTFKIFSKFADVDPALTSSVFTEHALKFFIDSNANIKNAVLDYFSTLLSHPFILRDEEVVNIARIIYSTYSDLDLNKLIWCLFNMFASYTTQFLSSIDQETIYCFHNLLLYSQQNDLEMTLDLLTKIFQKDGSHLNIFYQYFEIEHLVAMIIINNDSIVTKVIHSISNLLLYNMDFPIKIIHTSFLDNLAFVIENGTSRTKDEVVNCISKMLRLPIPELIIILLNWMNVILEILHTFNPIDVQFFLESLTVALQMISSSDNFFNLLHQLAETGFIDELQEINFDINDSSIELFIKNFNLQLEAIQ